MKRIYNFFILPFSVLTVEKPVNNLNQPMLNLEHQTVNFAASQCILKMEDCFIQFNEILLKWNKWLTNCFCHKQIPWKRRGINDSYIQKIKFKPAVETNLTNFFFWWMKSHKLVAQISNFRLSSTLLIVKKNPWYKSNGAPFLTLINYHLNILKDAIIKALNLKFHMEQENRYTNAGLW